MDTMDSNFDFRSFFQFSKDLLCITDSNGCFLRLNPQWERILGYKSSELEGKPYIEFVHSDDILNTVKITEKQAGKDENPSYTNRFRHKNGSYKLLEWHSTRDGEYTYSILRDVTRIKMAEEDLRRSETKYRLLFENMTTAFSLQKVVFDDEGHAVDYIFLEVNPVFEKYTGKSARELIGKRAKEVFPKTEDYWVQFFGNVARTGKPASIIDYSIELDKYNEIFSFCPEKGYCAQIAHDVTNRIKNEEILYKFKASIDYAIDGIFWINAESGFDYVNEQACKMLGYSREELLKLKISDIDTVAENDNFGVIWDRLNSNKRFESFRVESKHRRKDGSVFPVELNAVFVWNNNKGLLISYAKDITERKEYEESLLKSQKDLKDSQRVAKIGSWENIIHENKFIWHEEVYHFLGLKNQEIELSYENFRKLIHPDDLPGIIAVQQQIIASKKFIDHEYRVRRKDGEYIMIHVYGDVVLDDNSGVIRTYGIAQDVTEQRKNEEILIENQQLLKESQRIAKIGSWILDLASSDVVWSDETYYMFGYRNTETPITLEVFYSHVHPDELGDVQHIFENSLKTKHLEDIECRIITRQHTTRTILIVGEFVLNSSKQAVTLMGAVQDITERKQNEEALLKSQKLLNESQQIAQMGSWELKVDDNSLLWSDSLYKLYGIDKYTANLTQDVFIKLIHPDDEKHVFEVLEQAIKTGVDTSVEYRINKSDGQVRTMVTSIKVITDENHKATRAIGVVQDITESKIAKEALIESEERARLFVENTPLPIALFDTDMHYIIASKQWYKTYKVDDIDLKSRSHYAIFPETSDSWKDLHQRTINGEVIKCDKDKFIREDGSFQWVRYELHPWYKGDKTIGGMVAFTEDITEKVEAAEALKESEQKMQRLFDVAPVGLGIVKDRIIIDINSKTCRISGYSREELVGRDAQIIYPDKEEYDRVGKILYKEIEEKGIGEMETQWKTKLGENKTILQALTLIDPQDPSKGMVSASMDITEQKNYEQALEKRVLALTRPLNNISNFGFADLFNIDNLQEIQDSFAKATGVASLIVTPDGTAITRPSNFCNFCNLIRNNPKGEKKCLASDAHFKNTDQEGLNIQTCLSAGLWTAGAAIKIGGFHVANWLIGQIRNEQLNETEIINYAEELGIDRDEYIKNFTEVPVMSMEQFEHVARALNNLANELAIKAYQNLQQARFIAEQKKAEEEILKNQRLLLESQRIARMGSWELDLKTNKLFWNRETFQVYGYENSSVEPSLELFQQIVHPDDREKLKNHLKNTMDEGRISDIECRIVTPDGSLKHILVSGEAVLDKSKKPVHLYGIVQDITHQKKIEGQLIQAKEKAEESEHRLKVLHNASLGGIAIHDSGTILDCNRGLSEITGYSYKELIGMNGLLLIAEEYRDIVIQNIKQGYEKPYEVIGIRKNKTNYFLRLEARNVPYKGKAVRSVEFRDVSREKEIEKQIIAAKERAEESEYFLRESQQTGRIGSYKMNYKSHSWITTETLDSIFGLTSSKEEKTFDDWFGLMHPDDREMMDDYYQKEILEKKQSFDREYRIVRKNDNEIRWVHSLGKLYFDENGELLNILGTIQDITERKLIEEQREKMNILLEQRVKERTLQLQQVNEDLEAFAYSVSHDLRAPIRHIDGFVHLLQNTIKPMDAKVQNYINKIILSSKNMSTMIDELLHFSRLGRTDVLFREVDLNKIIGNVITQFKPDYANRNLQWKIHQVSKVRGEPALLRIAVENLVSNAIKYTSKKEKAIIEIGEMMDNNTETVRIFIKDNGAGFDMAYKEKLFGVFQRLHKSDEFEGTGIGLANVKQIITKHNGTIDVEAEINKGATFYITLKRHESYG